MYIYIILLFVLFIKVKTEQLEKYEGARCVWQELNGTCANIYRCESAIDNIKKKDFPPICSFRGKEPIVCCTDCVLVNDTRKVIKDPEVGVLMKTGSRVDEKCYEFLQTLDYPCKKAIQASYDTSVPRKKKCKQHTASVSVNKTLIEEIKHRFPHMAYLGYGEDIDTATEWLCGGTVISERYILTAASCVFPDYSVGEVKFVALALHKHMVRPADLLKFHVKRTILHPEYLSLSKYNDIALLEINETIPFGPNIMPACLDTGNPDTSSETNSVIWTAGENGTLDYVTLSWFDELECSIFYPPQTTLAKGYNHTTQMCLGDKQKPADSCEGEMGSPLQSSFKSCTQVIRGVASMKRVCGEAGSSGLFTRVSYYVPWIESIVWPLRTPEKHKDTL